MSAAQAGRENRRLVVRLEIARVVEDAAGPEQLERCEHALLGALARFAVVAQLFRSVLGVEDQARELAVC
jgi:hypothetical protein